MAINTESLRNELYDVTRTQIRNGIPPADLKNQLRAVVKQRVGEETLREQTKKPGKSIGGFLSNVVGDVKEVVQGLGALGGMLIGGIINTAKEPFLPGTQSFIGGLITEPKSTIKEVAEKGREVGELIVEEYKEYRHPLEKLYEDPFDVFLDILTIATLGGAALPRIGLKVATVAPRVGKAITTTGKVVGAPARAVSFGGISTGTRKVIRGIPGGEGLIQGFDNWSSINKLLNTEQFRHIIARNRAIKQVDEIVKPLSDAETNTLIRSAQGLVTVVDPTPEFQRAMGMVRSLAKDRELFGIEIGKLTPQQVELRKFRPLAQQLGIVGAGKFTPKALKSLKRQFPDADPVYVQHFFKDKPSSFADFFINTSPVRQFKPGFLKQFKGVKGSIGEAGATKEELAGVFRREAIQTLKWRNNVNLIQQIEKHSAIKPFKIGQELLPDHVVFAPDGLLRFYGGKIKLAEELAKAGAKKGAATTDDIFTVLKDSIDNVFPDEASFINATKEFVGVTKRGVRLFQVPKAIARQLQGAVQPSNPFVKIFWDKPLDAFRFAVLALTPRWLVNNLVGNTTFSLMTGDLFKLKPGVYKAALKRGLIPDEVFTGIFRVERTTSGNLGSASELLSSNAKQLGRNAPMIAASIEISGRVLGTIFRPVVKLGNASFKINELTDDFFRGTHFVNESLRLARTKFLRSTAGSFDNSLDLLAEAVKNPKLTEEAVASVNRWFYGAANLTNVERRLFRRVIPFYTWMRWVHLYGLHLALNAPARTNLLRNIGKTTFMFTGQDKLPDFLRGSVPIGNSPDGSVYYLRTSGANPFSSVTDTLTFGFAGVALQGAAPGIKTIFEMATGRQAFPIDQGRKFTREDIIEAQSGRLYRFNPESGEVEEVDETIRPAMIELLLRNYIPQYVLLENVLTGGARRYTAPGLLTILEDFGVPEKERQAVVKDVITMQSEKDLKRLGFKTLALGGAPIYEWTPELQKARQKEIETMTATIFNRKNPLFNTQFKSKLRDRIIKELQKGTSKEDLKVKLRGWMKQLLLEGRSTPVSQ